MSIQPRFVSTALFPFEMVVDLFRRSFENYFYPSNTTNEMLARNIRLDNVDLHHSLVMLIDDVPAGIALIGLRGSRAWCGGFGVTLPYRGRGLALPQAQAMIERARQAGVRQFGLEVLTRNERAIKTYQRAGMTIQRDLLILEWRKPEQDTPPTSSGVAVVEADAGQLLSHFAALHAVPAAWQRDLSSLLVRDPMQGLAVMDGDKVAAYMLYQIGPDGSARICDLAALDATNTAALLAALQARTDRIITINEPSDSPVIAGYNAAGFYESDRQHEMSMAL